MKCRIALRAAVVAAVGTFTLGGVAVGPAAANEPTAADRAFVREMVSHHQMAVEMARVAQRRGEHAKVRRVARQIVAAQTKEIRELKTIARRLGVKPIVGMDHAVMMEDAKTLGMTMDEMGMSMDMGGLMKARPFDREFIDMMIPHHQGAIRMARAELRKGHDAALRRIARAIVGAQQREIRDMRQWRKAWYGRDEMGHMS